MGQRLARRNKDNVYLLSALEDWATAQEFGQDTPNGPNVNCRRLKSHRLVNAVRFSRRRSSYVVRKTQHDFWSAVPACRDIFCHHRHGLVILRVKPSTEAEVANFELAVCVYEQVPWLQVSVDNQSGMYVLQSCPMVSKAAE